MVTGNQTIDMGASMETEEGLAIIDALNEVSDVTAMSGPSVTFIGDGPTALGAAGRLAGVDLYTCSRGIFLFLREPEGPHRAVAGDTPAAAADMIGEPEVRAHVRQQLHARGLL
jgi:hypothetical protein